MRTSPDTATNATTRAKQLAAALIVVALACAAFAAPSRAVLLAAVALTPVFLVLGFAPLERFQRQSLDPITGLNLREAVVHALDQSIRQSARRERSTGAMVIEIDRFKLLEERHDRAAVELILRTVARRLQSSLRGTDLAARLEGATFAVALSPVRRLDLEAAIQLSTRIQQAITEPIAVDGANVYITASVGFSLASRLDAPDGQSILQTATSALIEAQRFGPGAVRSFSPAMHNRIVNRNELITNVNQAMESGQIRAFFQPQVSTRTGDITGFEALARWQHPKRGLIPPIEFLPALAQSGLMDKLGEIMVRDALDALARWDALGFDIPRIGVNFSNEELRDPRLVDRISWELDKHDLGPGRLSIEVLETVVATRAEDIVMRNLADLAKLGCSLDLDDFGTGHASITSIRKYSIERIKIDRSFVTKIDEDPEQQKMVTAILTMAERLGLDTLAEGVETAEERHMLAKLGCGHIQGFGVARPLAPEDVDTWIATYQAPKSEVIHLNRLSAS